MGSVSFERKVLALGHRPLRISYPDAKFWGTSTVPLCQFEVIKREEKNETDRMCCNNNKQSNHI